MLRPVPLPFPSEVPTLGGRQFWSDRRLDLVDEGPPWRIQRHALTGHHRLLDGRDRRRAFGSRARCERARDEAGPSRPFPPRVAVLLHGLFRSRVSLERLRRRLEATGRAAVAVGYPAALAGVADHARAFGELVAALSGVRTIDVVAHSLGNLVVRHWLADQRAGRGRAGPALGRMVMLGPPNRGAALARRLLPFDPGGLVGATAPFELAHRWADLEPRLATPDDFGVITGGGPNGRGWNPLLEGDDDGVVEVQSAMLPGAADSRVLPVWHTAQPWDDAVHDLALRFLEHGRFGDESERRRIA
jgi:hypothetical protein